MKKTLIALAALACCVFTSCVNSDNPVSTPGDKVPLAEAVKLYTAPQNIYKLGTKEVLPIYVVVDNVYTVDGEKKYYNLSKVKEVKVDGDMFTVDDSYLVEYGYIKLIPNTESESFKESVLDLFEDYGAYQCTFACGLTLKNTKGETLEKTLQITYLGKNEFDLKKTCKVSDLDENNNYVVKETQPFGLFEWPFTRFGDKVSINLTNLFAAELNKEDGCLYLTTDGAPTEEGDPNVLDYKFERYLTGSPNPLLPDGEGLMVNFHIKLELTVTE